MTGVVVGTFEAENQAAQAVQKLLQSCVPSDDVRTLTLRPRHFGAASRRSRVQSQLRPQRGGITVAVKTAGHVAQHLAVRVLREHGARDVAHSPLAAQSRVKKIPAAPPSAQFSLPL